MKFEELQLFIVVIGFDFTSQLHVVLLSYGFHGVKQHGILLLPLLLWMRCQLHHTFQLTHIFSHPAVLTFQLVPNQPFQKILYVPPPRVELQFSTHFKMCWLLNLKNNVQFKEMSILPPAPHKMDWNFLGLVFCKRNISRNVQSLLIGIVRCGWISEKNIFLRGGIDIFQNYTTIQRTLTAA